MTYKTATVSDNKLTSFLTEKKHGYRQRIAIIRVCLYTDGAVLARQKFLSGFLIQVVWRLFDPVLTWLWPIVTQS